MVRQAVIFAGGLGTRLKPFTDNCPKPMFPINGKPFLEYLLVQMEKIGIREVVLLLGYLPEVIMDYFGDGSSFGIDITYHITPIEYETGARLREAKGLLAERFLLMYCDNYCPIDFRKLQEDSIMNRSLIQISAYANHDCYTKNNLRIDETGRVLIYDKSRTEQDLAGVDIGYSVVSREVVDLIPKGNVSFETSVYPILVEQKALYATVCEHRYYSCGSWERLELTKEFFSGKRYVFLDRDGTLNKKPPRACYVEKPQDYIWLDGAKEAIRLLKNHGYHLVLISNQPGVARGNMTHSDLMLIQDKMTSDLEAFGTNIDAFYYCEHNWDDGCDCRKPKPGLLYQVQRDLSFDLTEAYLIGDDPRDIEAGTAARCNCILVDDKYSVLEAAETIIEAEEWREN